MLQAINGAWGETKAAGFDLLEALGKEPTIANQAQVDPSDPRASALGELMENIWKLGAPIWIKT